MLLILDGNKGTLIPKRGIAIEFEIVDGIISVVKACGNDDEIMGYVSDLDGVKITRLVGELYG